jgi:hypothetical protein
MRARSSPPRSPDYTLQDVLDDWDLPGVELARDVFVCRGQRPSDRRLGPTSTSAVRGWPCIPTTSAAVFLHLGGSQLVGPTEGRRLTRGARRAARRARPSTSAPDPRNLQAVLSALKPTVVQALLEGMIRSSPPTRPERPSCTAGSRRTSTSSLMTCSTCSATPATLIVAWERVKRKPGVQDRRCDGQKRWHVEQRGVQTILGELRPSPKGQHLRPVAGARASDPQTRLREGPQARHSRAARQDRFRWRRRWCWI